MNHFQAFVDALSTTAAMERSKYHLTLGALIDALRTCDSGTEVVADDGTLPGQLGSYRGYYADLAIKPGDVPMTAAQLLESATAAVGTTYGGYKGGDFTMTETTPLWLAHYGCCGKAIVGTDKQDGRLVLVTREVDA